MRVPVVLGEPAPEQQDAGHREAVVVARHRLDQSCSPGAPTAGGGQIRTIHQLYQALHVQLRQAREEGVLVREEGVDRCAWNPRGLGDCRNGGLLGTYLLQKSLRHLQHLVHAAGGTLLAGAAGASLRVIACW
ncbi:hypothetical protein D3C76_997690 [compost metagenome]